MKNDDVITVDGAFQLLSQGLIVQEKYQVGDRDMIILNILRHGM